MRLFKVGCNWKFIERELKELALVEESFIILPFRETDAMQVVEGARAQFYLMRLVKKHAVPNPYNFRSTHFTVA